MTLHTTKTSSRPPAPHQADDGHWYVYGGYDAAGRVIRVEVDPPTVEMPFAPASQPDAYDEIPASPLAVLLPGVQRNLPTKEKLDAAKKGLFYREPNHGQWYESAWWWFWVAVTVVFAIWWITNSLHETDWIEVDPLTGQRDSMAVMMLFFGWIWWGWMPLGIGAVGALQKAGYKRFAAAFAITLTGLIVAFFARNERAGQQAAAQDNWFASPDRPWHNR